MRRQLTDDEVAAFVTLLAAAGAETTAKLIGNMIVYLFRKHPDQRRFVFGTIRRGSRTRSRRCCATRRRAQFQGRVAMRDVDAARRRRSRPGKRVALVTGAACRDAREFADPDRLDVTRKAERELYFGYGHHVCIGK